MQIISIPWAAAAAVDASRTSVESRWKEGCPWFASCVVGERMISKEIVVLLYQQIHTSDVVVAFLSNCFRELASNIPFTASLILMFAVGMRMPDS